MGHTLETNLFHLYSTLERLTLGIDLVSDLRPFRHECLQPTTNLKPAARAASFWPDNATIAVLQTLSHAVQSIPVLAPALYAGRRVLQKALQAEVTCGFRSRGCDPIRTEPHRVQLLEPVSSCCSPFPVSGLLDIDAGCAIRASLQPEECGGRNALS